MHEMHEQNIANPQHVLNLYKVVISVCMYMSHHHHTITVKRSFPNLTHRSKLAQRWFLNFFLYGFQILLVFFFRVEGA